MQIEHPELERAFSAADPAYDGRFVAAVRTTGIYCRPSCRARKPLPRNVTYLADAAAARAAGYRACLRCQPDAARRVTTRRLATPVGIMVAGVTDEAVVLLDFAARPMFDAQLAAVRRRIGPTEDGTAPLLDRLAEQLDEYFAGTRRGFELPLDMPGSAFQERVWEALRGISYGATISYRQLAERVGVAPGGYRAVGRANGSNRVAVIVPCHRVVAAGGGLGGYGGGLAAKRWLLDREASSGAAVA